MNSVSFVVLVLVWTYVCGQNEDASTMTGVTVCEVCVCEANVVDCRERNMQRFFEEFDLTDLNSLDKIELNLRGNPLLVLNRVPELPIYKLNLSGCDIGQIETAAFRNLRFLGSLDLSRNQLSNAAVNRNIFEGSFDPDKGPLIFFNLKYLSLAWNDIHALPKDIFNFMTELKYLDLSGNPLGVIDLVTSAAMSELKLIELKLSDCELESLPEGFLRRQRKLERLDLSNNKFVVVPSVLGETVVLRYLNFNKNFLTTLESGNALTSLHSLHELHLSRNTKLQSIGAGALAGLENLLTLHITNNPRLSSIDSEFLMWEDDEEVERWPMIEEFRLNNNNITQIDPHYLESWNQLRSADFSNNPYVCNCSNQWMVDVLVPLLDRISGNTSNMLKPSDMRGLSFETLYITNRTLVCAASLEMAPEISTASDMSIVLGVMIGIFVTFPIVLLIVLLWRNGYFARCRKKYQSDPVSCYDDDDAF